MKKLLVVFLIIFSFISLNAVSINVDVLEQKHPSVINENTNSIFTKKNKIYDFDEKIDEIFNDENQLKEINKVETSVTKDDLFKSNTDWYTPSDENKKKDRLEYIIIFLCVVVLVLLTYLFTIKRNKNGNKNIDNWFK